MKRAKFDISSAGLHLLAMGLMLCDHLWGTIVPGNDWLTCIGRLTFPIYAFMIVEGYFHTSDLKKYVKRLFIFAIISEIPFNLAMGSSIFYPIHQNVLWSFLIAIGFIRWNEKVKDKKMWKRIFVGVLSVLLAYIVGIITFVDFYHAGILTVLVFYFFRQRKWWSYVGQFACLYYINREILGGFMYEVELFGNTFFIMRQALAILALIPIWMYRGKQGPYNKTIKQIYYWFYPVHLFLLYLVSLVI